MASYENSALVLFSGGQDSTTCIAWALDRFERVETVGFDYGQRHRVELKCREVIRQKIVSVQDEWENRLREDHLLDISVLCQVGETAMTEDVEIMMNGNGLPNTFVPGRNLIFFNFAAAVAYRRGIKHIVGGMCETEYSGYPDCRDDTLKSLQATINLGMESRLVFHTPLMWLDKAQTWALADKLGGKNFTDLIVEGTHTCYLGDRDQKHDWGFGCGSCPACDLRADGFKRWTATQPR